MRHLHIAAILAITLLAACATPPINAPFTPHAVVEVPVTCQNALDDIVAQAVSNGWQIVTVDGADRALVVKNYNAIPPASAHDPDFVAFARHKKDTAQGALIMARAGCVIVLEQAPTAMLMELLGKGA